MITRYYFWCKGGTLFYWKNAGSIYLWIRRFPPRCRAVSEFHAWGLPVVIDMGHHNNYKRHRQANQSIGKTLANCITMNRTFRVSYQYIIWDLLVEYFKYPKGMWYFQQSELFDFQTPFQLHITDVDDHVTSLMEQRYEAGLRPEAPCNFTRQVLPSVKNKNISLSVRDQSIFGIKKLLRCNEKCYFCRRNEYWHLKW